MKNKTIAEGIKKILGKLNIIWSYHLPDFLVFITLFWMAVTSARNFFGEGNFSQILVNYSAIIALSIAISSTVFTYAQCNYEEKNELVKIGQLFLYASISMIMALLISWLGFEIKEFVQHHDFYNITIYFVTILFASNYMFFVFSALSFYVGLEKLEKHLFSQVRKDIGK